MNDWYFLVRVGMRGNFEAALSHVTVARSRAGGRVWNKQDDTMLSVCWQVELMEFYRSRRPHWAAEFAIVVLQTCCISLELRSDVLLREWTAVDLGTLRWAVLTVLWIGFCLTGPISLCVDLFLFRREREWRGPVCIFTTGCMNVSYKLSNTEP